MIKQLRDILAGIVTGTIISSCIKYGDRWFGDSNWTICMFAVLLVILATGYVIRAYKLMSSTDKEVWPTSFWAVIFGTVPVVKGGKLNDVSNAQAVVVVVNWRDGADRAADIIQERFREVPAVSILPVNVSPQMSPKEQVRTVQDILMGASSVILTRCRGFEENPHIYEAVDEWCLSNSHIPCLVVDVLGDKDYIQLREKGIALSLIPEKYVKIDIANPMDMPWRLNNRARQRSESWRKVAMYARSMVFFLGGLLCALLMATAYGVYRQAKSDKVIKHRKVELYKEAMAQLFRDCPDVDQHPNVKVSLWVKNLDSLARNGDSLVRFEGAGGSVTTIEDVPKYSRGEKRHILEAAFKLQGYYIVALPRSNDVFIYDKDHDLVKSSNQGYVVFRGDTVRYGLPTAKRNHTMIVARLYGESPVIAVAVDSRCDSAAADLVRGRDRIFNLMDKIHEWCEPAQDGITP